MKLSKTVRYLVRVRDYETVHVEVGAEADHRDLGMSDNDLAFMHPNERVKFAFKLRGLINEEVDHLAREELETVAAWSEISPNLAEDYLTTKPANVQRTHHARTKKDSEPPPTSGRRVRRASSASPTPLRPA